MRFITVIRRLIVCAAYDGMPWTCRCGAQNPNTATRCVGCGASWGSTS